MNENNIGETTLFLEGSFLLSVNLDVEILRKDYKLKSLSSNISSYSNQISYYLRKHKDLELYNNWVCNIEGENESLSIIFLDKNIYHKSKLLCFYQQAIVRMLDKNYKIDKKREFILIEEFIMNNVLDINFNNTQGKLFKF